MQALKVWATADAEETVVAAAREQSPFVSRPAIEALAHFKSEDAAEAAAAALPDLGKRAGASAALKAMGRIAEPYVIPLAGNSELFTRHEAWSILAAIGGKKSVKALKAELARAQWHEKDQLQKTIGTIESRIRSGANAAAAEPVPKAAAKSAAPKPRKWHDVTGTFSVEATFVDSADGKVTLKRANGRVLTVLLEKLSDEDQAYVEKVPSQPIRSNSADVIVHGPGRDGDMSLAPEHPRPVHVRGVHPRAASSSVPEPDKGRLRAAWPGSTTPCWPESSVASVLPIYIVVKPMPSFAAPE